MNTKNEKSVKTIKTEVKNEKKGEEVTQYILPRLSKKYVDSIDKIIKEGSTYTIFFKEGYTAFNQKSRRCKDVPGIMWYSKIATLEKQNGYNFEEYKKFLDKNKIIWDGKNIPEYIWTKSQYEKYKVEIPSFSK